MSETIDAFIFAAGLGTRMGPLSLALPKPAWTLGGRPLLHWAADSLKGAGRKKIACNAHHNVVAMTAIADDVEVIEEKILLGTGAPLKRIAGRIGPAGLLVCNADIVADVPWAMLRDECVSKGASSAWLLVPHTGGDWTKLYLDMDGRVLLPRGTVGPRGPYQFTGASWWSAEMAASIPDDCFDIRDFLAQAKGHFGVVSDPFPWLEIGSPGQLISAAATLAPHDEGRALGCYIHPEAKSEAVISRCILGPCVTLDKGMKDRDAFWYVDGEGQKRVELADL
ncbi:MAG: NTP transferase domain-containing protein [Holophagales bacterium]|nr:NTP transferase domain-containing protein [Holophagales bacterium]